MKQLNIFSFFLFVAFLFTVQTVKAQNSGLPDINYKANKHVYTPQSMKQISSVKGVIFSDDFETDKGWTTEGGWVRAEAVFEPSYAHSGNNIIANPLGSDYANDMPAPEYITSPVIDCSSQTAVKMSYWSYSGCEYHIYDNIAIEVYDGSSWVEIWTNEEWGDNAQEFHWTFYNFDVTAQAAGNANFQARFLLGPTDDGITFSGYAIDDFFLYYPETHDLAVQNIPNLTVAPLGKDVIPKVEVYNCGSSNESDYEVQLVIAGTDYNEIVNVSTNIPISTSAIIEFPAWNHSTEGTYILTATVIVADDGYADNNVLSSECTSSLQGK